MAQVQREKLLFHFIIAFIAGAVLWFLFGDNVPLEMPFVVCILFAIAGLFLGWLLIVRFPAATRDSIEGHRFRLVPVFRVPVLFLPLLGHVFAIGGCFWTMVCVFRLW